MFAWIAAPAHRAVAAAIAIALFALTLAIFVVPIDRNAGGVIAIVFATIAATIGHALGWNLWFFRANVAIIAIAAITFAFPRTVGSTPRRIDIIDRCLAGQVCTLPRLVGPSNWDPVGVAPPASPATSVPPVATAPRVVATATYTVALRGDSVPAEFDPSPIYALNQTRLSCRVAWSPNIVAVQFDQGPRTPAQNPMPNLSGSRVFLYGTGTGTITATCP